MSLDPFEARLQFLKHLRNLNASQQSIAKVVSFAVKYGSRCGEDLWECVMDEVERASLNARINILYFLDSLADVSLSTGPPDAPYLPLIERGLPRIVEVVVPDTRDGVLNLQAALAILRAWRARRVLDTSVVDTALAALEGRTFRTQGDATPKMSKRDILRRIEEDRERHKQLRERIWILPIPPLRGNPNANANATASPTPSPFTPASPAPAASSSAAAASTLMPPPPARMTVAAPLDVEFDQIWESTSDLDEDDVESMRESAQAAGLEVPI